MTQIKKTEKELAKAYFQILTLIIAIFSFAYIINSTTQVEAQISGDDFTGETGIEEGDINIVNVSFQSTLNSITLSCCAKMSNGAICQEGIAQGNEGQCETGWIPTKCNEVSECQIGCCTDTKSGVCSPQAPRAACETNGGSFSEGSMCTISQCQKNCCMVGNNAYYVTEKECEKLSKERGFEKKYVSVESENACILLTGMQKKGACTYDQGDERLCKFSNKEECTKINGAFSENFLCSNPTLGTTCKKQTKTSCAEGLDEVYWIDSCGNKENIYEGNTEGQKTSSWNNGIVKAKQESCNPQTSGCGNCDRFSGSKCAINTQTKEPFCKSLNCANAPDTVGASNRKNGESWCVYESKTGQGRDIPGSLQYLYSCQNGEVISESCGDFRNGLCIEEEITGNNGKFTNAACRANMAVECLSYNGIKTPEKKVQKCTNNPDCRMERFDFGRKYAFGVCLSNYPKGFDMTTDKGREQAKGVCKQANFECVKIMEKKISGWKCAAGCDCDTQMFTDRMTDWCTSLGDCGPSINVEGKFTENYKVVEGKTKISTKEEEKLRSYDKLSADQKINPDGYSIQLLKDYYGLNGPAAFGGTDGGGMGGVTKVMTGVGAVGMIAGIAIELGVGAPIIGEASITTTALGTTLGGIGGAAAGAAIGAVVGMLLAKALGIGGQGAMIMTVAWAVAGAVVGLTFTAAGSILGAGCTAGPIGCLVAIIVIIVVIIITLLLKLFGIGDIEETHVIYTCQPWQAPGGGTDCNKCNQDPLKQCTPYKCSTLGKTCEFINEGTTRAACVDMAPNDKTAPTITPWDEGFGVGYKYTIEDNNKIKLKTLSNECVPESTLVTIGLKTDEYAQCFYTMNPQTNLKDMEGTFLEDTDYTMNHTMGIYLPSAESLLGEVEGLNNTGTNLTLLEQQINEKYHDINYYVRCQDKSDNYNLDQFIVNTCVKPTQDTTPPAIIKTSPMSENFVSYNQTEMNLKVYTNEPANCKWSSIPNKEYTSMENEFYCKTKLREVGVFGWQCSTTLTGIGSNNTNFYIKCQDKPWLAGTIKESNRTASTQDYQYLVKSTKTILKIDQITPINGTIIMGGIEPFDQIVRLQTSGGVENGKAECKYTFTENTDYTQMRNTFSNTHSQRFDLLSAGKHTIYLQCTDIAGNQVEGQTTFTTQVDTIAPIVTRAFNTAGNLNIITNEESECGYTTTSCGFDFNNSTKMSGTAKSHTSQTTKETTYYIRCKDKYSNPQTGCSIIVKAY